MKLNLSGDSIKAFFVQHVEKFVLGIALLLVALFIYRGYSLKSYKRTPSELSQLVSDARSRMTTDTWEEKLATEEIDPNRPFSEEVNESDVAIDPSGYPNDTPWRPVIDRPIVKRPDPEGLSAGEPAGGCGIWPGVHPPAPGHSRSAGRGRIGAGGSRREEASRPAARAAEVVDAEAAAMVAWARGMGGYNPEGGGGDEGLFGEGGSDGGIFGEGGMGMPGEPGGGGEGMMGPGLGASRRFFKAPKYWLRHGGGSQFGGGGGEMMRSGNEQAPKVTTKGYYIVSVKALVRYQDQTDEFERVLSDCIGYSKLRDKPNYLSFAVERAEVGDDPNAELQWVKLSSAATALRGSPQNGPAKATRSAILAT